MDSKMILTTFVPEEVLAHIADDQMMPVTLKTVPITQNIAIGESTDYLVHFTPNRLSDYIGGIYKREVAGNWSYLDSIKLSQEISTSFVQGRLISGCLDVCSTTIASGQFALSGVINAVKYDNQIPDFGTLDYQTLLQTNNSASSKIANVPVADGVHTIVLPQGQRPIRTIEYAPYLQLGGSTIECSTGRNHIVKTNQVADGVKSNDRGVFGVSFPPGIYKFTASHLQITGPPLTEMEVSLEVTGVSGGVIAEIQCLTPPSTGSTVPSGFYSQLLVLNEVFNVDWKWSTSVSSLNTTYEYQMEQYEGAEPGAFPGYIYIVNNLVAGQTLSISGLLNYELVPNRDLIRDLPVKPGEYSPKSMQALNYMLSNREKFNVRDIYLKREWPAIRESFKETARLSPKEIRLASTTGILSFLKPFAAPLYQMAGDFLGWSRPQKEAATRGYATSGFAPPPRMPVTTRGYARGYTMGIDDVCPEDGSWGEEPVRERNFVDRVLDAVEAFVSRVPEEDDYAYHADDEKENTPPPTPPEDCPCPQCLDEADKRELLDALDEMVIVTQLVKTLTHKRFGKIKPEPYIPGGKTPEFFELLTSVDKQSYNAQSVAARVHNYVRANHPLLETSGLDPRIADYIIERDYERPVAKLPKPLVDRDEPWKNWVKYNGAGLDRRPNSLGQWVETFCGAVQGQNDGFFIPVIVSDYPMEGHHYIKYNDRYVSSNRKQLPELTHALSHVPRGNFVTFATNAIVSGSSSGLAIAAAGDLKSNGFRGMLPCVFTGQIGMNGAVVPVLHGDAKLKAARQFGALLIGSTIEGSEDIHMRRLKDLRPAIEAMEDMDVKPAPTELVVQGYLRCAGLADWAAKYGVSAELEKLQRRLMQPDGPEFFKVLVRNNVGGGATREENRLVGFAGMIKGLRNKGLYRPGMTAEEVTDVYRTLSTGPKYQASMAQNPTFNVRTRTGKFDIQPDWIRVLFNEDTWEEWFVRNGRRGPNVEQQKALREKYEQQYGYGKPKKYGAKSAAIDEDLELARQMTGLNITPVMRQQVMQQRQQEQYPGSWPNYDPTAVMTEPRASQPSANRPGYNVPSDMTLDNPYLDQWVRYYNMNNIPFTIPTTQSTDYLTNMASQPFDDAGEDLINFGGFDTAGM